MRLMQDLKSLLLANDMQFILSKNIQNTKETLQVPSGADASARATVKVAQGRQRHLVVIYLVVSFGGY